MPFKKPRTNLAYHVKRDRAISASGEEFVFSPNGGPKARREAIAKAIESSSQHQAVMEQQAGRKLTRKEMASGKHDVPTEPSKPRSLKKPKDPEAAIQQAVQSVREAPAHTEIQRQQRDARLTAMDRLMGQRELAKMNAQISAEHFAGDGKDMLQHVESLRQAAKRDPSVTPAKLAALDNIHRTVSTTVGLTKPQYFAMLQSAGVAPTPPPTAGREVGVSMPLAHMSDEFTQPQAGEQ